MTTYRQTAKTDTVAADRLDRCICGNTSFAQVFVYDSPPAGETSFPFSAADGYHREVRRCEVCGHFVSRHSMDIGSLYGGAYSDSTYGENGIRRAFDRINALEPSHSDNVGRTRYVLHCGEKYLTKPALEQRPPSILDVGSGLCVFLHRMKAAGWDCTALDPDPTAVDHARNVVGVKAICSDFTTASDLGRFDVITFNKVLEHASDPVSMLARSARFLDEDGFVYVELPDGECAVRGGPGREEFFIEHHHIFSPASGAILAARGGFKVKIFERLREPSSKYTLRYVLTPGERCDD